MQRSEIRVFLCGVGTPRIALRCIRARFAAALKNDTRVKPAYDEQGVCGLPVSSLPNLVMAGRRPGHPLCAVPHRAPLPVQFLIQVPPLHIHALDEVDLPFTRPVLDIFSR